MKQITSILKTIPTIILAPSVIITLFMALLLLVNQFTVYPQHMTFMGFPKGYYFVESMLWTAISGLLFLIAIKVTDKLIS